MVTAEQVYALADAAIKADQKLISSICRMIVANERQGSTLKTRMEKLLERAARTGISPGELVPADMTAIKPENPLALQLVDFVTVDEGTTTDQAKTLMTELERLYDKHYIGTTKEGEWIWSYNDMHYFDCSMLFALEDVICQSKNDGITNPDFSEFKNGEWRKDYLLAVKPSQQKAKP